MMQDWPLLTTKILDHAKQVYAERPVIARRGDGRIVETNYRALHSQALHIAGALRAKGIKNGDRVATMAWNSDRHLALWYGIMGAGAVCHTVNPRLFADQLIYIINHAEDRLLFTDADLLPIVARIRDKLPADLQIVALDDQSAIADTPLDVTGLDAWLVGYEPLDSWIEVAERDPCGLCYTSGTTGNPKGVLYEHRSNVIHALALNQPDMLGLSNSDTVMPIVPMFHANAWALTFVGPMIGASMVMPGRHLDGARIWELLDSYRVSVTAAVPTVWQMLLRHLEETGRKLPHLKRVVVGGAAAPRVMIETFERDYGVEFRHAWGMTELSPLGTVCYLPAEEAGLEGEAWIRRKMSQGRGSFTVEMRIVDDAGRSLPWDGVAQGNLQVRGPGVVKRYFGDGVDATMEGDWFPTGDVATIDPLGYMVITDRSKDVIKSGGEWISSIEIENLACGHPEVDQAAVIALPHEKWGERPLLVVVPRSGGKPTAESLLAHLEGKIAKWWMPDAVYFLEEMPLTATGKIRKTSLRQMLL